MACKIITSIFTSKTQEDIIVPSVGRRRRRGFFIGQENHWYDLLTEDWEDEKEEQKVRKIKDVTKLTGMIRDEWKLVIRVEVHGWVEGTKFERFWVCTFDWEIGERMMIYNKCIRIESQREKIKLEIWNW